MRNAARLQIVPPAAAPPAASPPRKGKRKKRVIQFLDGEQLTRLEKAIAANSNLIARARDRAMFGLALRAGLRASEVGLLNLADYDRKSERVFVHRLKDSLDGYYRCSRPMANMMHAWLRVARFDGCIPPAGPLFPSRQNNPISRQRLDALMRYYGRLAGIPPALCHFHVLKHSCATTLLARGLRIEEVQDWLGHAEISSTMIYTHLLNEARDRAADKVRDW